MIRDVMQQAGLAGFAEIGVIIFFVVFLLVIVRVLFMSRKQVEQARHLPLEEGDQEVAP